MIASTRGAEGGFVLGDVAGGGPARFQFERLGMAVDEAFQGATWDAIGFEVGAAEQGAGMADIALDRLDQATQPDALDDVVRQAATTTQGCGGGGQDVEDLVLDRAEGPVAELALLLQVTPGEQMPLAFEGFARRHVQAPATFQAALQRDEEFPIGDLTNLGDDCVHEALLASRE